MRGLKSLLFALVAFGVLAARLDLKWNASPSVPTGLYQRLDGFPQRGAYVEACVGELWLAREYAERRYLGPGPCPGGLSRMLKRVVAMPGDWVEVSDANGVRVSRDGEHWRSVRRQLVYQDSRGRALTVRRGILRLDDTELWLEAEHPQGLGSYLFGPVDASQVDCCYVRRW